MSAVETGEVAARWRTLRSARPGIRARDAAAEIGISEAELVASAVGDTAVRLTDSPHSLLHALPEVGRCMAVTRNASVVSELRGRYAGVVLGSDAGQIAGDAIDLRVCLAHWRHLFAIDEPDPQRAGGRRRSIQVFDAAGNAVHEVNLEPEGDARTWDAVVATRSISAPLVIQPPARRGREIPDHAVERGALIADWDAMTETHDFVHLLARHRVTQLQALRLAGVSRARPVKAGAIDLVLEAAASAGDSIRIVVGNHGCTQVFSGRVHRIVRHGPWLHVLDRAFNLHLRADHVAQSWVVARPTRAGVVLSLELFDADGEAIAIVVRNRDGRDCAEDPGWRAVLDRLGAVAP